ncbi:long-chain-fatty-acid--CoA ligase [Streptomyces sp. DSM 42041]|uniref:Long-chain-fatty-acid--CoA ligase n=1 Tax=Streptomyces hazeniae TaxID=3075538 RepID=A0ABU2NZP0_9ACTN|nr:long-chain-fatty-acid--CoA ligase [Streptomyces sp. DSM 42041]MDT0382150.1 long-chain-fatty-acid--CoA ligase [Streptomyces sp. DSM 42041]
MNKLDRAHKTESLVETIRWNAARFPAKDAIVCDTRALTYAELDAESDRTASALRSVGVNRGVRVAYLGKESENYYDVLFGCAKSGAVLVPINWRLSPPEIKHILSDATAQLIFVEEEFLAAVQEIAWCLPDLRFTVVLDGPDGPGKGLESWKAQHHGALDSVAADRDDPIVQIYTSGTTGLPKGVVLAHRSFFAVRDMLERADLDWIDWRSDDTSLIGVPGFHVGGLWWAVQGLNAGVTNIAMRAFVSGEALRLIREMGVTTTCMVPAMLHMLTSEQSASPQAFRTLRKAVYGGSPISQALLERCRAAMKCDFAQIYGLTETGNTAVCLPPDAHTRGGNLLKAAGRPYPGVDVVVLDQKGEELENGAVGEICIKTPARMKEYWRLPAATAETVQDGWVHTGDAGYLDAEGFLYICDRIKDVVIVAGENVYPAEIEKALEQLPDVAEAAVVGVPDERWGEGLHAVVVLANGATATRRQLALGLRDHLAAFKIPTSWEFTDYLPRNPSGKILRRRLREPFWSTRERNVG